MREDVEVRRAVEVDQTAVGQNAEAGATPPYVSWEGAGAVFATGILAYAAVRAVGVRAGDTVVVIGAGEGVGAVAAQLALNADATVIGVAGESSHRWLVDQEVVPIAPGPGVEDRVRAVTGGEVDAFIDAAAAAGGEESAALAARLGVAPDRVYTVNTATAADDAWASRSARVIGELAELIESGLLEIPILR
jgi:NADPH:quinone reductase-like Zn-dependent oxidoreductase